MSANLFPIAANIGDFVWIGIFVVGGLISLFNQIAAKQREQRQAAEQAARRAAPGGQPAGGQAPVRPAPGRQPVRGAGGAKPAQPQRPASLEDEIGDFLRRASQGRVGGGRGAQAPATPTRPAAAQPLPPRPAQARPVQARPAQARPARPAQAAAPVLVEVVEPAPRPVGGQVESRVAKDLDTREFKERAQRLGRQARQAAEKTQARVEQKFRREVGTQAAGQSEQVPRENQGAMPAAAAAIPASVPATSAAGFAVMLRDVDTVRQAILLNEILTRPVDRW